MFHCWVLNNISLTAILKILIFFFVYFFAGVRFD